MSVIKVVLRKKYKADGTSPLALRITKDRKSSFVYLGYDILEKDWDAANSSVKKHHPNSVRLNNLIRKKLSEASDKAIELDTSREHVTSIAVKQKVKPKGGLTFFGQAELYMSTLKEAGKYNQYTADKSRIKHFKEFLNGSDIAFSDITVALLQQFKQYCLVTLKVGERTAINHYVVIRSIFSQAIKNELTDVKYYPFGKGKISIKFPSSSKIGLDVSDLKKLEAVQLAEANQNHARNLWLLSFYFAGMRVSDLLRLKWSDFKNERLFYTMGKNLKPGSLKTPQKASVLLQQYAVNKVKDDDLIFSELKELDENDKFIVQRRIAHTASRIDKILRLYVAPAAKINKKITMHIARHSFANIAKDTMQLDVLQQLFRHSSLLVTAGYMNNFSHDRTDKALDSVLNFEAANDNKKPSRKRKTG